jgi:hypothetical protein
VAGVGPVLLRSPDFPTTRHKPRFVAGMQIAAHQFAQTMSDEAEAD